MPAVCGEFAPSLYLPVPEFPHIDGKTVSAQIQSEMNLWVYEMHKLIKEGKKKKSNIPAEITYRTTDLVCFCSCYYPVWWQNSSEASELFFSALGGFKMCQGYQRRHVFVNCSSRRWPERNLMQQWFKDGNKDGQKMKKELNIESTTQKPHVISFGLVCKET